MPTRPSWCIVLCMGLNSLKDTIYTLCQVKALQPSSEAHVGDNGFYQLIKLTNKTNHYTKLHAQQIWDLTVHKEVNVQNNCM